MWPFTEEGGTPVIRMCSNIAILGIQIYIKVSHSY